MPNVEEWPMSQGIEQPMTASGGDTARLKVHKVCLAERRVKS